MLLPSHTQTRPLHKKQNQPQKCTLHKKTKNQQPKPQTNKKDCGFVILIPLEEN